MTELTQAVEAPPLGTPDVPASSEATSSAPAEDSLAAHEAAHSPERPTDDAEPTDDARDTQGRFRPRRRAASQQADPDEVPVINELTKRFKTAVETHGKDITRKPGESERVFELRRRAEVIDRLATAPAPAVQAPAPAPPQPQRQAINLPGTFPAFEAFLAIQGNEEATYEDYTDARADWRYQVRREQERQQEAVETHQRTQRERGTAHQARVTTARAKYPDFDAVVTNDARIGPVLIDAILASEHSAEIAYYLGKHPQVRNELNAETPDYSVAAVNTTRRYLDSLVAGQRTPPPSRAAAGTTGSALALAPPPAPRPPNPVRTGAEAPADSPPDDSSDSLAAHEQFYHRRRR